MAQEATLYQWAQIRNTLEHELFWRHLDIGQEVSRGSFVFGCVSKTFDHPISAVADRFECRKKSGKVDMSLTQRTTVVLARVDVLQVGSQREDCVDNISLFDVGMVGSRS